MKLQPKDLYDELARSTRISDADRVIVARLIADWVALSARSVAGEDVAAELAIAEAALRNPAAGIQASVAKLASDLLFRLAVAVVSP